MFEKIIMTDSGVEVFISVLFIIFVVVSLTGNTICLVTYCYSRKLQHPHLYLPILLCVVDISSACFWTIMSIISMLQGGNDRNACVFQNMVMTFYIVINFHSLLLLGLERLLRIIKPSKCEDIVVPFVTKIVIGSLILFDLLYAFYPVIGWAEVRYYPEQYQCLAEYQRHVSHLNFLFVTTFVIPVCGLISAFVICFFKIRHLRSKVMPGSAIVLETCTGSNVESFANQVSKMNSKFQNAGLKVKKPKLQKIEFTDEGLISDPDTEDESALSSLKTRYYYLHRTDYQLLKTYVIISCVYVICWFPFYVLSYTWTYSRYTYIPTWLLLVSVTMIHLTNCVKPIVYYLFNLKFKNKFKKHVKTRFSKLC